MSEADQLYGLFCGYGIQDVLPQIQRYIDLDKWKKNIKNVNLHIEKNMEFITKYLDPDQDIVRFDENSNVYISCEGLIKCNYLSIDSRMLLHRIYNLKGDELSYRYIPAESNIINVYERYCPKVYCIKDRIKLCDIFKRYYKKILMD